MVVSDEQHVELCLYGEGALQDSLLIKRSAPGFGESRLITAARQMAAQHKDWMGDEGIGRVLLSGPVPVGGTFDSDLGVALEGGAQNAHPTELGPGSPTPPPTPLAHARHWC